MASHTFEIARRGHTLPDDVSPGRACSLHQDLTFGDTAPWWSTTSESVETAELSNAF